MQADSARHLARRPNDRWWLSSLTARDALRSRPQMADTPRINPEERAPLKTSDVDRTDVFTNAMALAASMPGIKIDRESFLKKELKRHCSEDQLLTAIEQSPSMAGISRRVLDEVAKGAITFETTKVTAISTAAGIPGGLAMLGTVPIDVAQNLAHMMRVSQKLAYIYGWPNLFSDEGDEMDDATKSVMILFLGIMFGANAANSAVTKVSGMIAAQASRKLPQQALTKGVIFPIVKKVATQIGADMTKQVFANGVSKVIPVVGALVSGGVTLATFLPMSLKLQKHLSKTSLAQNHEYQ